MVETEGKVKASPTSKFNDTQTPIAVIGMACRLPGNCNNPTDFWKFLLDGGIASTDVPDTRFSHTGHYDGSLRPGTMRSTGGMMLSIDPKDLDAGFFALSQVDAISMDPSQRQLLEVVYEGLENSGLTLESIKRKSYGCFVGSYASGKVLLFVVADDAKVPKIIVICKTVTRKIGRPHTPSALGEPCSPIGYLTSSISQVLGI